MQMMIITDYMKEGSLNQKIKKLLTTNYELTNTMKCINLLGIAFRISSFT